MASMNANLILAGQPVNVLGNYSRGMAVGQQANEIQRENALANLYKAQGAGIASGDQGALNALAQHDPMAALKVQGARQTMDIQQQENARADERLGMAREAAKRAAEQHIASLSAAERKKERETLEAGLAGATQIQTPEQWDAYMQQNGLPQLAGRFGERDILIAQALGVKDALEMNAPEKPADEYQRYVREQEAKGLVPLSRIEYAQAIKGNGTTMEMPDGTRIQVGGASNPKFTEAQSKDNVYSTRARGALEAFEPVANSLTSRTGRAAEFDPTGIARGALQSDDFQVAYQSGQEFLQAILRKDTGAAITQGEMDSYGKTYLPQPGDNDAALEAKRAARIRAVNALESGMSAAQMLARDRALIKAAEETGATQGASTGKQDAPTVDFSTMSKGDLATVDLSTLSEAELDAWMKAAGQ